MKENYNGKYEAHYSITVNGSTHNICKDAYNRFKFLVRAFDFGEFSIHEYKSVRKGPVLSRDLLITFTAYASHIIAFEQALDSVLFSISVYQIGICTATLNNRSVLRCDALSDFRD